MRYRPLQFILAALMAFAGIMGTAARAVAQTSWPARQQHTSTKRLQTTRSPIARLALSAFLIIYTFLAFGPGASSSPAIVHLGSLAIAFALLAALTFEPRRSPTTKRQRQRTWQPEPATGFAQTLAHGRLMIARFTGERPMIKATFAPSARPLATARVGT